jgi:endonuclease/exonuclease/phosphatase family metal-dependent hydrolase
MPRLRVATYNVHGFRAGTRQIAEAMAAESPDVLLLNETRYLGVRLRRFAKRMGMRVASGTGLFRRTRIPNAVLTRPPWRVVRHEVVALPHQGRTVRRGAVVAVVGRAGLRLVAAAVHLGLSETERAEHARILTDLLAGRREAVILGGDLNEEEDGRAASWVAGRYWDAFAAAGDGSPHTFPGADPRARIDYLFVSDGVTVSRAWVGKEPFGTLSDHLPVFADLEIG